MGNLAASPCSNPELTLDEALSAYRRIGFRKFEAFDSWAASALDVTADPTAYRNAAAAYEMTFSSMHLPAIGDDLDAGIDRAVAACRFAEAIGAPVVLYKADTIENYVLAGRRFLDAIDGIAVTPVVQNHAGSAIATLDDYSRVLGGIDDPRMQAVLEVGHFHSAGVRWQDGYDFLAGRIALVHIKDQIGPKPVPFGAGEIDLPGLFDRLSADGYAGDIVVEMELEADVLKHYADGVKYLLANCKGAAL